MRSISRDAVGAEVARVVVGARLLAEVDAAGELADDEQVGALDALALERARVVERRERADRAQVREEAQALAQAEQALLGPRRVGVGGVPLRAADGGEQDGVGRRAGGEHLVGERGAVRVDRGAAEEVLLEGDVRARCGGSRAPGRRSPGRSRRRAG